MLRSFSNVFRLGIKEFSSLRADKVLFAFIVYSFSFSVYQVATGVKTEVHNASVAIVDGDHSALSSRLTEALLRPYFRAPQRIDRSMVDAAMDDGTYSFVLDLPPRLEADVLRGHAPAVQLSIDATAMTHAGVGAGYIEAIVQQETKAYLRARGIEHAPPIRPVSRAWFNPNLEGVRFQSVMGVVENITILSILLVGAAVVREREHGTIEHLLVMPVRATEVALAKIWANGLVILVAAALSLLFVVQGLLRVPVQGSIVLFLSGAAMYLFATTSLAILLATIVRSMPQFSLLAIPIFLVLNMLSGATSPLESMPAGLQLAIQVSPAVHFVKFAHGVLYRGAQIEVVWPHLLTLAIIGAGFLAVALARFRSMLTRT